MIRDIATPDKALTQAMQRISDRTRMIERRSMWNPAIHQDAHNYDSDSLLPVLDTASLPADPWTLVAGLELDPGRWVLSAFAAVFIQFEPFVLSPSTYMNPEIHSRLVLNGTQISVTSDFKYAFGDFWGLSVIQRFVTPINETGFSTVEYEAWGGVDKSNPSEPGVGFVHAGRISLTAYPG